MRKLFENQMLRSEKHDPHPLGADMVNVAVRLTEDAAQTRIRYCKCGVGWH